MSTPTNDQQQAPPRCTCARSWGLHSQHCALYTPGHELITATRPTAAGTEGNPVANPNRIAGGAE